MCVVFFLPEPAGGIGVSLLRLRGARTAVSALLVAACTTFVVSLVASRFTAFFAPSNAASAFSSASAPTFISAFDSR